MSMFTVFADSRRRDIHYRRVTQIVAGSVIILAIAGCASGNFSSTSTVVTPAPPAAPNSNPPSLPALTTPTQVNDYVGTQPSGFAAPDNTPLLHLDQKAGTYSYTDVALVGQQANPTPDSNGLVNSFLTFRNLGDTSGSTGLPGPQYFGLAIEKPSRLAFFASNNGQSIAALVPRQNKACITPTAAARYSFVTLPNATFNPASDPAWGTFDLASSGSGFNFGSASQYSEPTGDVRTAASTSLIPLTASQCKTETDSSKLGYFIDTSATTANGTAEMRSFLGPTGLLVSDIQGNDANGAPLSVPGFIAMIQPTGTVDLSAVTGSPTSPILYQSFLYQATNSPAVQYGFMGQNSAAYLTGVDNTLFTAKSKPGLSGGWQPTTSFSSPVSATGAGSGAFVFGPPDPSDAGLFPRAQILYPTTDPCIPGETTYATGYCASSAVAIVGLHDGKFVILVSGLWVPLNNSPFVLLLVQE